MHKVLKLYPVIVILLLSISVYEFSRKKLQESFYRIRIIQQECPRLILNMYIRSVRSGDKNDLFHIMAYIFQKKSTEALADTSKTKRIKEININCKKTQWLSAKVYKR